MPDFPGWHPQQVLLRPDDRQRAAEVISLSGMKDPHAFWIVVGLCGLILVMQLVLFWRWKWF